jgi:hypothetical protein
MLAEKIHDGRFIKLIRTMLEAGYLEDWRYGETLSGTPQGGHRHAPNNVAKPSLIPDSVISRTRLRPKYGQGWQPRLDPHPRQADGRGLGEEEST